MSERVEDFIFPTKTMDWAELSELCMYGDDDLPANEAGPIAIKTIKSCHDCLFRTEKSNTCNLTRKDLYYTDFPLWRGIPNTSPEWCPLRTTNIFLWLEKEQDDRTEESD